MTAKGKKNKKTNPKNNIKSKETGLTLREERFCYEYVLHLNATKACILAGYAQKSAYSAGSRLLKNVKIQDYIKHLKDNLAETAQISALKVLQEHQKIAFSSIANLHNTWIERTDFEKLTDDQKANIKSISTKVVKKNIGGEDTPVIAEVEYVKIELYDKQKSLDSITQMLGYNAPIRQEVTGKDGKDLFSAMTDDELDGKIKELDEKLRR